MQIIKTPLNQVNSQSQAELISYVDPSLTDALNPALIFVPGGSYTHVDFKQSEKVALRFLSLGFQVSILRYSFVDEAQLLFPAPLLETGQAVAITKQNAESWHVDPKKVVLMGFSVGGHVVANYNNLWSSDWLQAQTHLSAEELKPAATILGYPVITPFDGFPDQPTLAQWTDNPDGIAADRHVTADNAPTFIWATTDDQLVSSKNAVDYFLALQAHQVPTELHLYHHGPHGMALADETTAYDERHQDSRIAGWIANALAFLREL